MREKKVKTNENFWVRVSGGGDKKEAREREREKQMNKTGKERKILHQNKRERKEECVS